MAADDSGSHLPSWPDAPRRDGSGPRTSGSHAADVPTSWPETPVPGHGDPAWPEPPRKDDSWPEPPRRSRHAASPQDTTGPSWPEPPQSTAPGASSWPDLPPQSATSPSSWSGSAQNAAAPSSWPDTPHRDMPASWPETSSPEVPMSWPEASRQSAAGPPQAAPGSSSRQDRPPQGGTKAPQHPEQPQVPDPVPAWAQPPAPAPGAWPDEPAPRGKRHAAESPELTPTHHQSAPNNAPPHDGPSAAHPPPPSIPASERTITYAKHSENLRDDRAVPSTPMDSPHTDTPPGEDHASRPGSNLNRDPSDPDRRFVTAGQISGSRTPPPERQQELWNTVFGDNYQAMGEQDALEDEPGKPVWMYALGSSVAVALVIALVWAFLAGPLASEDPASSNVAAQPSASKKPRATKTSSSIGPLPKYSGKPSPVLGRIPDAPARISVPRLGGDWRLDQRATVKATYGFDTRQYVQVAPERYAQLMTAPLSQRLASYYERDDLEPVIKQVVLSARRSFFPKDNKVRKIAQQAIKVGDSTGRLIAYSLTSQTEKATIVTMAVNTGGNVPAIVYMSIPAESKQLLPDIRTVMNQIRLAS
ncbi:hypothetical protein [Nonomuraea sp. B5E05]|uniref:hypothetical protein n=1 Tax=Nonomuraea sp. B5E05 TaxID=3153569 RepID=UPI003260471F